jgi:hypothetical protein
MAILKMSRKTYQRGFISVTDLEVRTRLQFLGLSEEDLGVIASWQAACRKTTDHLVDVFYDHIQKNPVTRDILLRHSSVERQRPMLTRYVLTMFSGRIDDEYVQYRRQVGNIHDDIDLDSNWYVSMYEMIRKVLVEAIIKEGATLKDQIRRRSTLPSTT